MRTLGIDPGYDRVGIAIVENSKLIYSECFETSRADDANIRIHSIGNKISDIIQSYKPQLLSIETLFFTNNQKTAMRVSEARGVIIYEACKNNVSVFELSPLQVKVAVTGYGKSDKQQVTDMVKRLVKINKEKVKDDEYDAIAIALAGEASYPQRALLLQKK